MARYEVLKECNGGKYRVGMIVDDSAVSYQMWHYFQEKVKEGAFKILLDEKPEKQEKRTKVVEPSETK